MDRFQEIQNLLNRQFKSHDCKVLSCIKSTKGLNKCAFVFVVDHTNLPHTTHLMPVVTIQVSLDQKHAIIFGVGYQDKKTGAIIVGREAQRVKMTKKMTIPKAFKIAFPSILNVADNMRTQLVNNWKLRKLEFYEDQWFLIQGLKNGFINSKQLLEIEAHGSTKSLYEMAFLTAASWKSDSLYLKFEKFQRMNEFINKTYGLRL